MSLCPVCGRALCDHTPEERGQTVKEMMRDLSTEEEAAWKNNPFNDLVKREVARKHVHDPV